MNLLLVILRKIWVSRSRCFQTGNRHFQTLFELSFIFEETIFFGKLNQNIKSYVRYDLSVSRTRPGSETEQPSVTQKPSTPTNATRGRSNQQEKSTTWAFSFDRATPSFLSKRISGNQGAVRFQRLSGYRGICYDPYRYASHAAKGSIDEKKGDQRLVRYFSIHASKPR